MNLIEKPFGHFISGHHNTTEHGDSFIEIKSIRFKQKVRIDFVHGENVNDQIGQWLTDNGHEIIAWSNTFGKYIFICTPVKSLS